MKKADSYISKSLDDTFALGRQIGASLRGAEVLALYGDLGAGKTVFTQGVASGLGVKTRVNSPTFNIIKIYKVRHKNIKNLCHIDAYRLENEKDLINIGVEDYLGKEDTVTVIEWAEKVEAILKTGVIRIQIKYLEDKRQIVFLKK